MKIIITEKQYKTIKSLKIFKCTSEEFIELVTEYLNGYGHLLNKMYDKIIVDDCMGWVGMGSRDVFSLPNNLELGYFGLYNSKFKFLPENLKINNKLLINSCPIKTIPATLYVGNWIDLMNTKIELLPDNLKSCKRIDINGTPLSKNKKLVEYYISRGFNISKYE